LQRAVAVDGALAEGVELRVERVDPLQDDGGEFLGREFSGPDALGDLSRRQVAEIFARELPFRRGRRVKGGAGRRRGGTEEAGRDDTAGPLQQAAAREDFIFPRL